MKTLTTSPVLHAVSNLAHERWRRLLRAAGATLAAVVCALALLFGAGLGMPAQAAASVAGPPVPLLSDWQHDARQAQAEHKPIILFFSLPGCSFCHVVRNNYLQSMLRDKSGAAQAIIREVDMTGTRRVTGLDGKPALERDVAKTFAIRAAPTVIMIDASGKLLTTPIIGGDVAGFYGGYLDAAMAEAEKKVNAAK